MIMKLSSVQVFVAVSLFSVLSATAFNSSYSVFYLNCPSEYTSLERYVDVRDIGLLADDQKKALRCDTIGLELRYYITNVLVDAAIYLLNSSNGTRIDSIDDVLRESLDNINTLPIAIHILRTKAHFIDKYVALRNSIICNCVDIAKQLLDSIEDMSIESIDEALRRSLICNRIAVANHIVDTKPFTRYKALEHSIMYKCVDFAKQLLDSSEHMSIESIDEAMRQSLMYNCIAVANHIVDTKPFTRDSALKFSIFDKRVDFANQFLDSYEDMSIESIDKAMMYSLVTGLIDVSIHIVDTKPFTRDDALEVSIMYKRVDVETRIRKKILTDKMNHDYVDTEKGNDSTFCIIN